MVRGACHVSGKQAKDRCEIMLRAARAEQGSVAKREEERVRPGASWTCEQGLEIGINDNGAKSDPQNGYSCCDEAFRDDSAKPRLLVQGQSCRHVEHKKDSREIE